MCRLCCTHCSTGQRLHHLQQLESLVDINAAETDVCIYVYNLCFSSMPGHHFIASVYHERQHRFLSFLPHISVSVLKTCIQERNAVMKLNRKLLVWWQFLNQPSQQLQNIYLVDNIGFCLETHGSNTSIKQQSKQTFSTEELHHHHPPTVVICGSKDG